MIKKIIFFILFIFSGLSNAQQTAVLTIDNNSAQGIELDQFWKFHEGDDSLWSTRDYNDNPWDTINIGNLDDTNFKGIGWFRIHLIFDSTITSLPLAVGILQASASEIYFDGQKLMSFGVVSSDPAQEKRCYPNLIPVALNIIPNTEHVLSIRYSNHKTGNNRNINYGKGFRVFLFPANDQVVNTLNESVSADLLSLFPFGFIIALGIAHLFIFLFYRANKSNLFYFLFATLLSFYALVLFFQTNIKDAALFDWYDNLFFELVPALLITLLMLAYSIFYERLPKIFWYLFVTGLINFLFILFQWPYTDQVFYLFIILILLEIIRIVIIALINKKEGSLVIGIGVAIFILFVAAIALIPNDGNFSGYIPQIAFRIAIMSIPVSMSLYLAKQFATTNKNLQKKLTEVEYLSAKNIEQEKEKQKILASQNEVLEIQVQERTHEIVEQKKMIEEKNKDITDSINYAKTIQQAILPNNDLQDKIFPNAFILFKPKDIVSGDFYWFAEKDGKKLIAACDCTGHGVPGALMSMVGNNILNQIINERGITAPDEILNHLHKEIRKTLKQEEQNETKDGMDIALLTFNSTNDIEFAGAQRPLWIVRNIEKAEQQFPASDFSNYELAEIKGNKIAIGGIQEETERKFTNHKISVKKGDCIYIFTDGFADQFSSADEKLMTTRFKKVLLSIQTKSIAEQQLFLNDYFENWKGRNQQIDDVLVIGIRI